MTDAHSKPDYSTLLWVKEGLEGSILLARQSLEEYADSGFKGTSLAEFKKQLHQVFGTLKMVQVHGACMLVEEMEAVATAVLEQGLQLDKRGAESLMLGLVQLPAYLDNLEAGHADIPLSLLPVINDLRSVRGSREASVVSLYAPNLDRLIDKEPVVAGSGNPDMHHLVRELRNQYQMGLLAWYKGEDASAGLRSVHEVIQHINANAGTDRLRRLMDSVEALVVVLEEGEFAAEGDVKTLIGRVDRYLKRLIDVGEEQAVTDFPLDLLKNVLYFVSRSNSKNSVVLAVKKSADLANTFNDVELQSQYGTAMGGPTHEIILAVRGELQADLEQIKDNIDLFIRGGTTEKDRVAELLDNLQQVADTLGMIGMGNQRVRVNKISEQFVSISQSGEPLTEEQLLDIATEILRVEKALDRNSVQKELADEPEQQNDEEYVQALIKEAFTEFSNIKGHLEDYLRRERSPQLLQGVKENLEKLVAVFEVVKLTNISDLLKNVEPHVSALGDLPADAPIDEEALVDVFAGIEYYLEMVLENGANPEGVLDYSRKALVRLDSGEIPELEQVPVRVAESTTADSKDTERELELELESEPQALKDRMPDFDLDLDLDIEVDEKSDEALDEEVEDIDEIVQMLDADIESSIEETVADDLPEQTPEHTGTTEPAATTVIPMDEVDPEIFDIFMEEAYEELAVIQSEYPKWRVDVDSAEPIDAFRRSFHTLKGSGRMVGALTIGEFAWAIETLLNKILDRRIPADARVISLMDTVVEVLPQLIEGQAKGEMPDIDIASIQEQAFALAEGRAEALVEAAPEVVADEVVDELETAEEVVEQVSEDVEEVVEPAPIAMDTTLLEIFGSEANTHLSVVNACVSKSQNSDYKVSEELIRAVHTLRGSSHLAEVGPMAELSAAMENYCNLLKKRPAVENQSKFTDSLRSFHQTMNAMLDVINVAGGELPTWQPLVERIQQNVATLEEAVVVKAEVSVERQALAEATAPTSEITPLPENVDLDLLEIFLEEADELSESLDAAVAIWEKDPDHESASDDIKRSLHTLKGGARLAGVMPVGDLVHALESIFEGVSAGQFVADDALISVVRETVDQLHLSIETLRQNHGLIDFSATMAAMEQFVGEIPSEVEESLLIEETEFGEDFEDNAESLLQTTEWAVDTSTVYEETIDKVSEESAGDKVDIDSELLEIFLEEAMEMAEQLESGYADWTADTSNQEPLAGLLRSLHTLKGGARLAGLGAIGDLVHALESLFEGIIDTSVKETPQTPAIVRHALDGIEQGLDQLLQSRTLPTFESLIEALAAAVAGKEWDGLIDAGVTETEQASESIISSKWTESSEFEIVDEDDSSFMMDSQLLTDSELLSDSQIQPSSVLLSGEAKVLEFPGSAQQQDYKRPNKRPPPLQAEESLAGGGERVRVRSELLDQLVNYAGEVSIYRARLEQQNNTVGRNLEELSQTVGRLQNQVRSMEIETEAQIISRHEGEVGREGYEDFDPLEMDRYSTLQQLSRALSETINDLSNIGETLEDQSRDTDTLLLQQARVTNDLQDGLLRTRMVPFRRQASRLERVVRQTASSTQKKAELLVQGADGEIDRTILNRIMGPLEHLLRNAVAHGIEAPAERRKAEKPDQGKVSLILAREGADIAITISDDGRGLNVDAIKERAIERGLMEADADIEDDDIYQFILEPGFSTVTEVTQISGRGVGMDAVMNEIKILGGSLEIESQDGRGSSFVIRLPFTLAITEALLISLGDQTLAIPHGAVEVIVRATREDLMECYNGIRDSIEYHGHEYKVRYMGSMLGIAAPVLMEGRKWFPVLLVRAGEHRVAIQVDQLLGNHEIVVKSIGNQLGGVRWFTGGTILADGDVALILDVNTLVRSDSTHQVAIAVVEEEEIAGVTVMVVDDSITVRKVTSRLLERHNMEVITAKDGVDAVTVLQDHIPDIMLLDIEMPRMDGYELARHMRHTPELSGIPIIMITSRTGDKHRQRAIDLGVKRYLGKPYQEAELLDNIYTLLAESAGAGYE